MVPIYLATILLLLNPVFSFLKERADIKKDKKRRSSWIIPIAFLAVGIVSAGLSFYNGKSNLDGKNISDSTAEVYKERYDAVNQKQIDFLGGGSARPLFAFVAMSSNLFQFAVIDSAQYPLRDIRVTVQNDLAFADYKSKFKSENADSGIYKRDLMIYTMKGFSNYGKDFRIPFITASDYYTLFTDDVGNSSHLKYTVDISWSNGDLAYYIECFKKNGAWQEQRTCYDRLNKVSVKE